MRVDDTRHYMYNAHSWSSSLGGGGRAQDHSAGSPEREADDGQGRAVETVVRPVRESGVLGRQRARARPDDPAIEGVATDPEEKAGGMVTTRHDAHQDVAGFAELTEKFDELNQKAAALTQARAQQAQFDELTRKIEQLTRTAMVPQRFEELLSKVDALTHKVE